MAAHAGAAMNFLAHLYLSSDDAQAMVGNLAADFVKGPDVALLAAGVREGVRQHRSIDAFTDRHAVVHRSIGRIAHNWGWFAGIIIDVYYDHVLAVDWSRYSPDPLRSFADRAYDVIRGHAGHIPEPARQYALRFVEADRLMTYAVPDGSGVEEALRRLSARIAERIPKRALPLHEAMSELREHHAALADDFHEFFPEAVRHAAWRCSTNAPSMPLQ